MTIQGGFRFGCSLAVALAIWSAPALAIDDSAKGAARDLSSEGKVDFDAGRFDAAAIKFQKAFDIVQVPTLALWSARCASKLGRWVAASELYRQALQLPPNELWVGNTQQEAQAAAQAELDSLTPRIPKLRIVLVGAQPSQVTLTVDGVLVPSALVGVDRPTDPGQRRVTAKRRSEVADINVMLAERDIKEVVLKFSTLPAALPSKAAAPLAVPPPIAPSLSAVSPSKSAAPPAVPAPGSQAPRESDAGSTQRLLGWIGVGVGAAGVLEGAVTGIFVVQRYSKLKAGCPNETCDPDSVDSYRMDMYNSLRTASLAGFIVGGLGLATGTTLLLTSPSRTARVGLFVGPTSATVQGTF